MFNGVRCLFSPSFKNHTPRRQPVFEAGFTRMILQQILKRLVTGVAAVVIMVMGEPAFAQSQGAPPPPLAPIPTPAQLAWQDGDQAMLVSFGINTFSGQEEGTGKEDPKIFNPSQLDVRQWVRVAKECGFKRLILPVKGHEGFCLWSSKTTDYGVQSSPWKDGHGDILREFTDACRTAGLEAGFYLSAEDRHCPLYGTPGYNGFYLNQLREVLAGYGKFTEVRFDGAGGEGTGAFGFVNKNLKDRRQVYDWPQIFSTVSRWQPQAIMVSSVGPGARWNGNNIGHAGEANWCPFNPAVMPGPELTDRQQLGLLNAGDSNGPVWLPAECCVRFGTNDWFWHAGNEGQLQSLDRLVSSYFKSAGHNCDFLLSVPVNNQGLIPEAAVRRLREFHAVLEKSFQTDLAAGKPARASNVRGNEPAFGADQAVAGRRDTYWATDDAVTGDCWLEVDLGQPITFNTSAVREQIALGQRVVTYRIDYLDGDQWKTAVHGRGIGRLKLERFAAPVTARKVRLMIEAARACPAISQFSLYLRTGQ